MRNWLPLFLAVRPRLNRPAMSRGLLRNLPARRLTQSAGAAVVPGRTAYPSSSDTRPESLTREHVLEKLRGGNDLLGANPLLVDRRGNDHEVSSRPLLRSLR